MDGVAEDFLSMIPVAEGAAARAMSMLASVVPSSCIYLQIVAETAFTNALFVAALFVAALFVAMPSEAAANGDHLLPTVSLRRFDVVWAAAGTSHDVFAIGTEALIDVLPGPLVTVVS